MASCVHVNVCFACDKNEGVAALAKKHNTPDLEPREARWFLTDLSARTGNNTGPKGGLLMWGMVTNYMDGENFVEALLPFWQELLGVGVADGPCSHERVIVFTEVEQKEQATAFEIYWDEDLAVPELIVKKHLCPFSWMQF